MKKIDLEGIRGWEESEMEELNVSKLKALPFISRHPPTKAQKALVREMGYEEIKQINITFSNEPLNDLREAGITSTIIAIVAPNYVFSKLLNKMYTLIEFVNESSRRMKGVFVCKGAYIYHLKVYSPFDGEGIESYDGNNYCYKIGMEYIKCPIPIEEQEEVSLNY